MYVVRDTFRTKPGKANALIEKFTAAAPHLAGAGVKGHRILVDEVADYWTVDFESTVEDLESYFAFRENTAGGGGGPVRVHGLRRECWSSDLPSRSRNVTGRPGVSPGIPEEAGITYEGVPCSSYSLSVPGDHGRGCVALISTYRGWDGSRSFLLLGRL